MFVCCECFVLSGRGLRDELIIRPEESYRLLCVVVCDLEKNLKNEEAMTRVGSQRQIKKKLSLIYSKFLIEYFTVILQNICTGKTSMLSFSKAASFLIV
jgi:hypothetical protein